jgi:hypothetical protein
VNDDHQPPNSPQARALAQQKARRIGQAISVVSAVVVGLSWFRIVPISAAWAAFLIGSIASQQIPYAPHPNVTKTSWIIWVIGMVLVLAAFVGAPAIIGLIGFGISVIGSAYYWFG